MGTDSKVDGSFDGALDTQHDGAAEAALGLVDRRWAQWPLPAVSPALSNYGLTPELVTDHTTGLVWQRAPASPTTMEWGAALTYCASLQLEGQTGFRLPTRIELLSVLDYGQSFTLSNETVFSGRPTPPSETRFWTSSESARTSAREAYFVGTSEGSLSTARVVSTTALAVRCVKEGFEGTNSPRYVTASRTASDPRTGLVWRKDTSSSVTLAEARAYCTGLAAEDGVSSWRLPTIRELHSLVDETETGKNAWDHTVFPDAPMVFWSATTRTNPATGNYLVDFGYVTTFVSEPTFPYGARCVGQKNLP